MSEKTIQTFSDIIRGMQHAVNSAQEILQDHQFRLLQSYFNQEDGSPLMTFILLPDGRQVSIPKISLIPQNMLAIDELDMAFSVTVGSSEVKTFKNDLEEVLPKEQSRSSFEVAFARRVQQENTDKKTNNDFSSDNRDTIDVKIKFKAIPLTEGAARVQDLLNIGI